MKEVLVKAMIERQKRETAKIIVKDELELYQCRDMINLIQDYLENDVDYQRAPIDLQALKPADLNEKDALLFSESPSCRITCSKTREMKEKEKENKNLSGSQMGSSRKKRTKNEINISGKRQKRQ